MSMQCPSCRKSLDEGSTCPRCSCDFGSLLVIRAKAGECEAQALGLLQKGDFTGALSAARQGFMLQRSAAAARYAALACLGLRDFQEAVKWHGREGQLGS